MSTDLGSIEVRQIARIYAIDIALFHANAYFVSRCFDLKSHILSIECRVSDD